jgi:hypothetical protein
MKTSINAIVFLVFAAAAAPAQQFVSGNCSNGRFSVSYRTVLEPVPPDNGEQHKPNGLVSKNDGCFRHLVADPKLKQFVAYAANIEPVFDGEFKVTFEPMQRSPEEALHGLVEDLTGWSQIAISKFPGPQQIRDGDTIALDLLVNPTTGQKMVDYLTVRALPWGDKSADKGPKIHWAHFHAPEFPAQASNFKLQGMVVLEFDFNPASPNPIRVLSGHPILARAATESLRQSEVKCVTCDDTLHTARIEYVFKRADPACDNPHDAVTVDGNRVTVISGGACLSQLQEP